MKGKYVYTPGPKQPSPSDRLICQRTGTTTFATFPEIHALGFPEAPIVLKYGKHFAGNRGYGFRHIWAEHYPRVTDHDDAQNTVIAYVGSILVPSTPIYWEEGEKAAVFRGAAGQVIVELRGGEYSVVTAYITGNAKGSRIGALAYDAKP